MIEEKEKLKSSSELDFVSIVEDQKPENSSDEFDFKDYVKFCKDCKESKSEKDLDFKIFKGKKILSCKECGGTRIVSGIEKSLKKYFRVK